MQLETVLVRELHVDTDVEAAALEEEVEEVVEFELAPPLAMMVDGGPALNSCATRLSTAM